MQRGSWRVALALVALVSAAVEGRADTPAAAQPSMGSPSTVAPSTGSPPTGSSPTGSPPTNSPSTGSPPGASPPASSATATGDATARLRAANAAAQLGDWDQVRAWLAPLSEARLGSSDRAELHRLRGLAGFFAQHLDVAEVELLAYLRLDADAHLDPATVPPEAITFFESVSARHRAELRALHAPATTAKRSFLLTFVPVAGQLQNGQRRKAWAFGLTLGGLAVANLGTYALLRRWCRSSDGTCDSGGVDHTAAARRLLVVNAVSGIGLAVVYAVEVYDAITGYRRERRRPTVVPVVESGQIGAAFVGSF
jgi:hypothetical protein